MKQIDDYFFEDDFEYKTFEVNGITVYHTHKQLYQDLRSLLYSNAIGRKCETCGAFIKGNYFFTCEPCRHTKEVTRYKDLPVKASEWYYSEYLDIFFEEVCEVYDALCDADCSELTYEDLLIYPCDSYFASELDIDGCFDEAPEEFDLKCFDNILEINKLVDQANALIRKTPIGFNPNKKYKAIVMTNEEFEEFKHE